MACCGGVCKYCLQIASISVEEYSPGRRIVLGARPVFKLMAEAGNIDRPFKAFLALAILRTNHGVMFADKFFVHTLINSIDELKKVFVRRHVVVKVDVDLFLGMQSVVDHHGGE